MNILLTGGAGFIGSHTCVELIQSGYSVVIADNFSNSSRESVRCIREITGTEVPLYKIDVRDNELLDRVFTEHEIDAVIHFAGYKAVGESTAEPLKYYRNNIDAALSVLEVMKKHGVHKFIFSSSATVYGNPETVPLTENMPVHCTNPYGWTKLMIERILTDTASADPDMSVVLLRYFNPIGAHESGLIGDDPGGIPNNLMPYIARVAAGQLNELSVFGDDYPTKDGTGVRDYIHVADLAKGHVAALKYAEKNTGTEVFNLGTGIGYSVLEIIRAFEEVSGVKIPYRITARRPGDAAICFADPSRAFEILGWKAEKTLHDMCRDAWRHQNARS